MDFTYLWWRIRSPFELDVPRSLKTYWSDKQTQAAKAERSLLTSAKGQDLEHTRPPLFNSLFYSRLCQLLPNPQDTWIHRPHPKWRLFSFWSYLSLRGNSLPLVYEWHCWFQGAYSIVLLRRLWLLGQLLETRDGYYSLRWGDRWCHFAQMGFKCWRLYVTNAWSLRVWLRFGTSEWMDRSHLWLQAIRNLSNNIR